MMAVTKEITPEVMEQYETVIGLEVHVELATKTKIFCNCSTKFGGEVNAHTCPVCMGMPGTLPVLNQKVLEYAIAVGLALHCNISSVSKFDRKNYFYPDNPQNYQISQLYSPICQGGYVEIAEGKKKIRIHEIHMEEDAGKLFHEERTQMTCIDYNRAGVPLLEIVSEPDMENEEEVIEYLEELKMYLRYLGVSDCKLQEGSMRADVNLSVRKKGQKELGTRTEMKNLNSFSAIRMAILSEKKRQITLLENGEKVEQETRRFDETTGSSYVMRSKDDAMDYRYFPEPDLLPIEVSKERIAKVRKEQPEFRDAKKKRFMATYPIPAYDIDLLTQSKTMADLFEEAGRISGEPKKVSNYLMGEGMRLLKEHAMEPEEMKITPKHLAELVELTVQGKINQTIGKAVFEVLFLEDISPAKYVEEKGLKQESDAGVILKTVSEVLEQNPEAVQDYYAGKEKAVGFLVGQGMKKMQGKANPQMLREAFLEQLKK